LRDDGRRAAARRILPMNILRSEFLKLISVRTTWLLLGAMILIEGTVAGLLAGLGEKEDLRPANVPDLLIGTPLSILFVFTLGALISTNEFRHGTANSTFLITPRRERVIAAKLVVGFVVGLVAALEYVAVNAGLGLSILSSRDVTVNSDQAVDIYVGVGIGFILICLFGVALGAVVRNQVAAIVGGLALFLALRGTLTLFIGDEVGRYFPAESLLGLQGNPKGKALLLDQVDGGLVLAGYCLLLTVAGMIVTRKREIT
jgi:ABC-type transport system involved in multi-copper enzyme maturation permease subunit